MQIIILIQIIIFLFISPLVLYWTQGDIDYLFSISIVFLFAFLCGLKLGKFRGGNIGPRNQNFVPIIPSWLKPLLIFWTALYASVVVSNDLLFRRQGSEVMAELYSNLPISNLLILRCYEISFFPILIVMIASLSFDKARLIKICIFIYIIGFLFMGVLDSRAKLLMPIIFYYMIFFKPNGYRNRTSRLYLYIASLLIFMAVLIVGMDRIKDFNSFYELLIHDFVKRTDGLELISLVNKNIQIPFVGTLDSRIMINFISMIPFHSEAQELKLTGLTSSKNFLLREIIGAETFDMNNSVVSDLYYYGGFIGLIVGSLVYGYFVGKFDVAVKTSTIWSGRARAAFLLAFMINAFRIEVDYFSIILATSRDFIVMYVLFLALQFISVNVNNQKDRVKLSSTQA